PVSALAGFGSARFVYNVSNGRGSLDLNEAAKLYVPYIDQLLRAGVQPIVILNHQTWGEERGFNWKQMDAGRWRAFSNGLAEVAGRIAWQFADDAIVWQVGNQQDAPPSLTDSIYIPPVDYGYMFNAVAQAVKG